MFFLGPCFRDAETNLFSPVFGCELESSPSEVNFLQNSKSKQWWKKSDSWQNEVVEKETTFRYGLLLQKHHFQIKRTRNEQQQKSAAYVNLLLKVSPMHNGIDVGGSEIVGHWSWKDFTCLWQLFSVGQLYCAGHRWQDTTAAGSRCALRKKKGYKYEWGSPKEAHWPHERYEMITWLVTWLFQFEWCFKMTNCIQRIWGYIGFLLAW